MIFVEIFSWQNFKPNNLAKYVNFIEFIKCIVRLISQLTHYSLSHLVILFEWYFPQSWRRLQVGFVINSGWVQNELIRLASEIAYFIRIDFLLGNIVSVFTKDSQQSLLLSSCPIAYQYPSCLDYCLQYPSLLKRWLLMFSIKNT